MTAFKQYTIVCRLPNCLVKIPIDVTLKGEGKENEFFKRDGSNDVFKNLLQDSFGGSFSNSSDFYDQYAYTL